MVRVKVCARAHAKLTPAGSPPRPAESPTRPIASPTAPAEAARPRPAAVRPAMQASAQVRASSSPIRVAVTAASRARGSRRTARETTTETVAPHGAPAGTRAPMTAPPAPRETAAATTTHRRRRAERPGPRRWSGAGRGRLPAASVNTRASRGRCRRAPIAGSSCAPTRATAGAHREAGSSLGLSSGRRAPRKTRPPAAGAARRHAPVRHCRTCRREVATTASRLPARPWPGRH